MDLRLTKLLKNELFNHILKSKMITEDKLKKLSLKWGKTEYIHYNRLGQPSGTS